MIVAKITDGLGNQLFQYAAARRLAHFHNTTLRLDTFALRHSSFRSFALHHFNINAEEVTLLEMLRLCPQQGIDRIIRTVLPGRLTKLTLRILGRLGISSSHEHRLNEYTTDANLPDLLIGQVVSQRFFQFDEELLNCPNNVYLVGYWQNEGYFKDIANLIKQDFSLRHAPSALTKIVEAEIEAKTSVSLHVRRGDKILDSRHHSTSLDFCYKAIKYMQMSLATPHFFVFSDDWEWVNTHLPESPHLTHVKHNDSTQAHQDLYLMSHCKHNIIASSSLSWWGAWLNSNPEKIVVSPSASLWVNIRNHNTQGVLPDTWVVLE